MRSYNQQKKFVCLHMQQFFHLHSVPGPILTASLARATSVFLKNRARSRISLVPRLPAHREPGDEARSRVRDYQTEYSPILPSQSCSNILLYATSY